MIVIAFEGCRFWTKCVTSHCSSRETHSGGSRGGRGRRRHVARALGGSHAIRCVERIAHGAIAASILGPAVIVTTWAVVSLLARVCARRAGRQLPVELSGFEIEKLAAGAGALAQVVRRARVAVGGASSRQSGARCCWRLFEESCLGVSSNAGCFRTRVMEANLRSSGPQSASSWALPSERR